MTVVEVEAGQENLATEQGGAAEKEGGTGKVRRHRQVKGPVGLVARDVPGLHVFVLVLDALFVQPVQGPTETYPASCRRVTSMSVSCGARGQAMIRLVRYWLVGASRVGASTLQTALDLDRGLAVALDAFATRP